MQTSPDADTGNPPSVLRAQENMTVSVDIDREMGTTHLVVTRDDNEGENTERIPVETLLTPKGTIRNDLSERDANLARDIICKLTIDEISAVMRAVTGFTAPDEAAQGRAAEEIDGFSTRIRQVMSGSHREKIRLEMLRGIESDLRTAKPRVDIMFGDERLAYNGEYRELMEQVGELIFDNGGGLA